MAGNGCGLL